MHILVPEKPALWPLLQRLLEVRHAHLMSLEAVTRTARGWRLEYCDPDPCRPGCGGVPDAVGAVHEAGLWVGDLKASLVLDASGRVVLGGVGGAWDPTDPFAGHPSTRGLSDLRVSWRQQGDTAQLEVLPDAWTCCPAGQSPARAASIMERLSG